MAETARGIRGQRGYVAAFAPNENYFSGRDGRVLYFVAGEALPAFRVAAFLDYRPVALRVRRADDRHWATEPSFEGALEPARETAWEIELDDVPPGTSELALVLDSGKRLIETADPDTARPMLNRHILVYRLQRGEGQATPPPTTEPTVQKAQHCERNEKVLRRAVGQWANVHGRGRHLQWLPWLGLFRVQGEGRGLPELLQEPSALRAERGLRRSVRHV